MFCLLCRIDTVSKHGEEGFQEILDDSDVDACLVILPTHAAIHVRLLSSSCSIHATTTHFATSCSRNITVCEGRGHRRSARQAPNSNVARPRSCGKRRMRFARCTVSGNNSSCTIQRVSMWLNIPVCCTWFVSLRGGCVIGNCVGMSRLMGALQCSQPAPYRQSDASWRHSQRT
jgi:hypothetical protein